MPEPQRRLHDPLKALADDDGSADPSVRQALAASVSAPSTESYLAAVAALCGTRLLTPIVAVGEQGPGGGDTSADMSAVLLSDATGRRAMLVFTGVDSLQRWDARARPVPATLDKVAEAALAQDAVALLVDLEGPHPVVLEQPLLGELARSRRLVALPDGGFGWMQAGGGDPS
ncbi:SseB family protein [Desertihabitans brevis]|uniref:SseB family protein n=1 Tax=Desertihabitans brevis TaxID=2268447 RepID=A0A367YQV5_9ACTN|nr:SseB family protein [Desertihabitans brevis]RCK68208.1 SseB family protein [Desertihabitans brevis]